MDTRSGITHQIQKLNYQYKARPNLRTYDDPKNNHTKLPYLWDKKEYMDLPAIALQELWKYYFKKHQLESRIAEMQIQDLHRPGSTPSIIPSALEPPETHSLTKANTPEQLCHPFIGSRIKADEYPVNSHTEEPEECSTIYTLTDLLSCRSLRPVYQLN
jgi:hypothetical protein